MVSARPVRRPGVRESTHSPLSVESDLRVRGRKPPGSTRMCGSAYTGRWWGRASRSVSRVLCPTPRRWRRPSLSGRRCRRPLAAYPGARAGRPRTLPVWPCSGWGLPSHASHLTCWWSLAPPFHPYRRRPRSAPAVCFLWHCPAGHPGLRLATTLPCGARTFLGGSPLGARRGRPTDSPAPPAYAGHGAISEVRAHAGWGDRRRSTPPR